MTRYNWRSRSGVRMAMQTKIIATALAFGCLAFTLSVLPITRCEAACVDRKFVEPPVTCFPGEDKGLVGTKTDPAGPPSGPNARILYYFASCCCNPPKVFRNGVCEIRPVKNIGKGSPKTGGPKSAAILKANCEKQGGVWDYKGECIKQEQTAGDEPTMTDQRTKTRTRKRRSSTTTMMMATRMIESSDRDHHKECGRYDNKKHCHALALGFLAFTLSVLPVTTAEAVECYMAYDGVCTKGGVAVERGKHLDPLGVD